MAVSVSSSESDFSGNGFFIPIPKIPYPEIPGLIGVLFKPGDFRYHFRILRLGIVFMLPENRQKR